MIDEYDTQGEEKITPLINLAGVSVTPSIEIDRSKPYAQSMDMRTGVLKTRYESRSGVKVEVETILAPYDRTLAERWTLHGKPGQEFSVLSACSDVGGSDSPDPKSGIWKLMPNNALINARHGTTATNAKWEFVRTGVRMNGAADAKGGLQFVRLLEFARSPNHRSMNDARQIARGGPPGLHTTEHGSSHFRGDGKQPADEAFDQALYFANGSQNWETDIEIDGPVEDQQAIRSFVFYLRNSIAASEDMSISPYGLSNSTYNGHVFWDADIWVFPALALIDPERAKTIAAYRLELKDAARRNFDEWMAAGRPHATGSLGIFAMHGKAFGYKFPWESSVTGRETVPGPSKYEEHISGDVAWMLNQAASLKLVPADMAQDVTAGVGSYYRYRAPGGIMTGVMSPDENHIGENDLYTNLLAQWCSDGGRWVLPEEGAHRRDADATTRFVFKLPKDDETFLTYDNDALRGYKQAAAVLSIYPLQYPPAEARAQAMMERFADKTTPNGPAMSDSLHALIYARMGQTDKAYDTWRKSWQDFVKGPFLLFSEKRKRESTYFTTGAAGCLQTVLYGFLGFRIDSKKQAGAGWSTNLALGQVLSVKPNLPKTWKSVKFKNFTVLGRRYTLIATHPDANGKGGLQVIQGDH